MAPTPIINRIGRLSGGQSPSKWRHSYQAGHSRELQIRFQKPRQSQTTLWLKWILHDTEDNNSSYSMASQRGLREITQAHHPMCTILKSPGNWNVLRNHLAAKLTHSCLHSFMPISRNFYTISCRNITVCDLRMVLQATLGYNSTISIYSTLAF